MTIDHKVTAGLPALSHKAGSVHLILEELNSRTSRTDVSSQKNIFTTQKMFQAVTRETLTGPSL